MPTETITHQKVVDLVMTLPKDRLTNVYDFLMPRPQRWKLTIMNGIDDLLLKRRKHPSSR